MGDGSRFENGDYGLASSTLVPSAQNLRKPFQVLETCC